MKRSAGPKPRRKVVIGLPPSSIGLALISTPCSIKNFSSPGSTKVGRVVANVLAVLGSVFAGAPPKNGVGGKLCGGGVFSVELSDLAADPDFFSGGGRYVTAVLKRPVMDSPWL